MPEAAVRWRFHSGEFRSIDPCLSLPQLNPSSRTLSFVTVFSRMVRVLLSHDSILLDDNPSRKSPNFRGTRVPGSSSSQVAGIPYPTQPSHRHSHHSHHSHHSTTSLTGASCNAGAVTRWVHDAPYPARPTPTGILTLSRSPTLQATYPVRVMTRSD